MQQVVDGVVTTFAWDWAAAVPELLDDGANAYLVGLDTLGWENDGAWAYVLPDALGSVRQQTDATGAVVAEHEWTPYGVEVGEPQNGLGYAGEWWDTNVGLQYLRARWYDAVNGRFTQRDPRQVDPQDPLAFGHLYLYVGDDPIDYVDPTGMWRWWLTGSTYHFIVEQWYEGSPLNSLKQLEYPIPGTPLRHADIFNSLLGDVYEIEPWYRESTGRREALGYVNDLSQAARQGLLTGQYFGIPYDWTRTPFHVGTGGDWPGKLRRPMPSFPWLDLVADYAGAGVVLYWLEPNLLVPASLPFLVPSKHLVRPPNWTPGRPVLQPVPMVTLQEACGYTLIVIGGAVVVVTVAEDVATLGVGTFDDVLTVPAGLLFISWGQRMATFVPTSP